MRMSKRRRLRRSLGLFILLILLSGAGWTGLWYVVAGRLADHVMAWETQERAAGWVVTHGRPTRTGWPMAAGITLPGIAISGGPQDLGGGVTWRAGTLTLALDIRHPNDLFLSVGGRQSVAVGGHPALPFQATRMIGRIALRPGDRPGLVELHATGLLAALRAADGTPAPVSVGDLVAAIRPDDAALAVAARLSGVSLPPHPVGGKLGLDGQGRFQLDPALRPMGSFALTVTGLDDTINRMVTSGFLSRPAARAITAMLGLMMRPPQPAVLHAPLTLHGGVVSLGAIPLIRLSL
jgi:hypothetical protein